MYDIRSSPDVCAVAMDRLVTSAQMFHLGECLCLRIVDFYQLDNEQLLGSTGIEIAWLRKKFDLIYDFH